MAYFIQKGIMLTASIRRTVEVEGVTLERLKSMLGAYNAHLKLIEQRLDVKIAQRGDFAVNPRACCCSSELTLTTMPAQIS